LTARSVLGSALIGTTRGLSSRTLTAIGSLFGIAPTTSRVALSRMVAAGEVAASGGRYRVAGRFQRRQARQTTSVQSHLQAWDGTWGMWIVRTNRRTAPDRIALRNAMVEMRYGEHREGVWMRPTNLPNDGIGDAPSVALDQADRFSAAPSGDAALLADSLWDLTGWAARADAFRAAIEFLRGDVHEGAESVLAPSFLVLVAIVHHLDADPLLPAELLPKRWPGQRLREDFATFEADWQKLLAVWRRSLQ
jgi:phenylacetic acid degradation operon negative regulatory protein